MKICLDIAVTKNEGTWVQKQARGSMERYGRKRVDLQWWPLA